MSSRSGADEARQLERVKAELRREFPALSSELVDDAFAYVVSGYTDAPVRAFVPVLAQRELRHRLRQLA